MKDSQLVATFTSAKHDTNVAIIEGAQALKHALRFKAEIIHIVTADKEQLLLLLKELAPDITSHLNKVLVEVGEQHFQQLSPKNHRTKVVALAKRPIYKKEDIDPNKPIVFLENPKDLENIGAVIRVAAAADTGAVISSGEVDIWHTAVIRGGAGLQYAIPVFNGQLEDFSANRQLIAFDPTGEDIRDTTFPKNAVLLFGTERHGITKKTLAKADKIIRLPMKQGVSSLNLATSVAATLYGGRIIDY